MADSVNVYPNKYLTEFFVSRHKYIFHEAETINRPTACRVCNRVNQEVGIRIRYFCDTMTSYNTTFVCHACFHFFKEYLCLQP